MTKVETLKVELFCMPFAARRVILNSTFPVCRVHCLIVSLGTSHGKCIFKNNLARAWLFIVGQVDLNHALYRLVYDSVANCEATLGPPSVFSQQNKRHVDVLTVIRI